MAKRPDRHAAAGAARAVVSPGSRVTIIGTSGSGKSTLLRQLIRRYERAVLLDVKLDDPVPDWHHSVGAAALVRDFPRRATRVVAQPAPGEDYMAWFDRCCTHLFAVGAVAVGIDDLPAELSIGGQRSPGLELLYRQGRSKLVTTIGCIQRPKMVPLVMLSEASQLYIFALHLEDDRKRIREVIGPYPEPRVKHGFTFARPGAAGPPLECRPLSNVSGS